MPARTGYEHLPQFWTDYLACSVGHHLAGQQPDSQLRDDYELFLGSPGCSAVLRDLLPPVPRKKKVKT